MTTGIILFISLLVLIAAVEEIIYFFLRTRIIDNHQTEKEGKIKSLYKKVKLKLSPS